MSVCVCNFYLDQHTSICTCVSVCVYREEDPDDAPHGHITSLVGSYTIGLGVGSTFITPRACARVK